MIRVKDIEKSLKFYQDVLGMSLIRTSENPNAGFNLYFLGYPRELGPEGKTSNREGLLELTWNYGTEKDDSFRYHNGNDDPQGFGHIGKDSTLACCVINVILEADCVQAITVDDLEAACQRFEDLNCNWKKRLTDGRMKEVAFLLDPDNYWVEIVQNDKFKGKPNW